MTDDIKKTGQSSNDDLFLNTSDDQSVFSLGDNSDSDNQTSKKRGNQGFASMSRQKQREIASKGGKAAHQQGTAHEWNSKEAAEAGRRGGQKRAA